jgi:hypothetical protein
MIFHNDSNGLVVASLPFESMHSKWRIFGLLAVAISACTPTLGDRSPEEFEQQSEQRNPRGLLQSYPGRRTPTPSSFRDLFSCCKMQPGLNRMLQGAPNLLSRQTVYGMHVVQLVNNKKNS